MEYSSGTPIYLQVIRELQKKMIKGELKPGDKMPSNRELAVLYKVNQNTAGDPERRIQLYKTRDRDICLRGGEYV